MYDMNEIPARFADSIVVDEIGLEYGIYGDFRLRSAFQPVFAHDNGQLSPVAVEALVVPHHRGQPLAMEHFLNDVPSQDRGYVDGMRQALLLANRHNIDADGIGLIFRLDMQAESDAGLLMEEMRIMVRRLDDAGFSAETLVCEINVAGSDGDRILAVASEVRGLGMRIIISNGAAGRPSGELIRKVKPEIVRIDRVSLARFCADAATERLFRPVVAELKDLGAAVFVEGIETENHLDAALGAGADLFLGDLLEKPALVGSVFDDAPRGVDAYRPGGCVVIPLFG